jgi:hypothetical protein
VTVEGEPRVVMVEDERTPLATEALELISYAIGDVQPVNDLLSEVEERRRGMPSGGDYHLLAMVDDDGRAAAAAAGIYLEGVNAGFITPPGRAAGRGPGVRGEQGTQGASPGVSGVNGVFSRLPRGFRVKPVRHASGVSAAPISVRRGSSQAGSCSALPSADASSSTEKPGPSVAISTSRPSGALKYRLLK